MELWDLYTKYREKTGKVHKRGEPIPEGFYHLVVHVWIRNKKGEYLLSQRAANRPTYPLLWECVGGSVLKGENSVEGAIREVKEEVGITLNPSKGTKLFTKIRGVIDGQSFGDIMDVWLFAYNGACQLEKATTDEVAACRWATADEIKRVYEEGKLVPTLDYFFCAMEETAPDHREILGKTVTGKVDRPIGSLHPKHPDLHYPINYGYVQGIFAADGEEQDAYIFGIDQPLEQFKGKVIKVYHRFNDTEDKWIVSLDGTDIPDEKILGDIAFQEQFFYGKLYGSCGMV